MSRNVLLPLFLLVSAIPAVAQESEFFETPLSVAEMQGKQAVLETTAGTIVIELLPDVAPNHVGHFIDVVQKGGYDGTAFHRVIRHGIIQGGDPLSKDPADAEKYGTGGLGVLKAELSSEKHTRGAVSAVLVPGKLDSAGTQFFICITDQPALDGQYTIFGRVVEGILAAQKISEVAADAEGRPAERMEIVRATIRETPPPEPTPFADTAPEELASYRAVLETSKGEIAIELMPDKAPEHVRNFLRLAELGVYDGMTFHRVAPGFVIQTGHLPTRREPLTERQQQHVPERMVPEFNDTVHDTGVVSMARLDAPDSATTSFFICTARAPALDGQYTAFGRVVSGLEVVEAIEQVPTENERPLERVDLLRVRIERK